MRTRDRRSDISARFYALAISRLVGALALLATGGIHLEQYIVDDYRAIPTIGLLFLLNFIGGTVLGLYFLAPARARRARALARRLGRGALRGRSVQAAWWHY